MALFPQNTQKRGKKISKDQKDYLVEFLQKNPKIVTKKFTAEFTRNDAEKLWHSLTAKLNKIGPAIKNTDGWKKCYKDLKVKTKSLARSLHENYRKTGGSSSDSDTEDYLNKLSPNKQKLLSLMGGTNLIEGLDGISEFGINSKIKQFQKLPLKEENSIIFHEIDNETNSFIVDQIENETSEFIIEEDETNSIFLHGIENKTDSFISEEIENKITTTSVPSPIEKSKKETEKLKKLIDAQSIGNEENEFNSDLNVICTGKKSKGKNSKKLFDMEYIPEVLLNVNKEFLEEQKKQTAIMNEQSTFFDTAAKGLLMLGEAIKKISDKMVK